MGTKTAMSFANIFMAEIETKLIQQNNTKPREWKRYIVDVFSLWDCKRNKVERFIEQPNTFHPAIKFTAEISENEITFLDTVVTVQADGNLSIYPFYLVPSSGAKRGFMKGEA